MKSSTARLKEKITLVTGGSKGIGRAIALRFATEGARVIAAARGSAGLDALVRESEHEIVPHACDCSDPKQIEELFRFCRAQYGRIDILVNNAAMGGSSQQRLHEIELDAWDEVMNMNVRGPFIAMRCALAMMLETGGGAIVNIASIGSFRATPGLGPYCSSKGALMMMTRTAALEYAKDNIRVNALCPATINTPILDGLQPEYMEMLLARCPQGRLGTAEEVASFALFLASDEASHVNGGAYLIDGGRSAG